jgi:enoyl-CoA hydratase/carnithine racemase
VPTRHDAVAAGAPALSLEDLLELAARPEAAEAAVTEGASPLTVVAVDERAPTGPARAEVPRLPWRVVVGVTTGAPTAAPPAAFDVALCRGPAAPGWVSEEDLDAAVAVIAATATGNPHASAVACQLLRVNEHLSLADGLVAESFAYSMLLAGPEFAAWNTARTVPPYRPSPDPVVVGDDGGTVTVTLNRPAVRNAYDSATRDALVDALRGLAAGPEPPPVLLRGNGPAFCSGGDLSQFGTTPDPVTAHAARTARSPGLLLHQLGATARVHGACVGAGIELPAFCTRVVAAAGTTFRLPEVAMGLVPGAGGTASILARVGRQRTAYLALTGRPLPVPVALDWGLVDEVE